MDKYTEDRFLADTANHKMTVIRDAGVDRHIRFRKPGTICYGFDLITWHGHLCITGDCGTYVFQRIEDMFGFFRTDPGWAKRHPEQKLFINSGYWGEKLISIDRHGGYREFDKDRFKDRVTEYFTDWKESEEPTAEQAEEMWEQIDSMVLSAMEDGEHQAYQAAYEFKHDGFQFVDFFDGGGAERYTFHYLWCLYAIVWGIQRYDSMPAKAA